MYIPEIVVGFIGGIVTTIVAIVIMAYLYGRKD